jgi:hypothetical protein
MAQKPESRYLKGQIGKSWKHKAPVMYSSHWMTWQSVGLTPGLPRMANLTPSTLVIAA